MITENVLLEKETKKKLQHLSIDKDIYISTMLIDMAKYFLQNNCEVQRFSFDGEYEPFTMKINSDLKEQIRVFCKNKNVRIKDFWNEIGYSIVKKEGE